MMKQFEELDGVENRVIFSLLLAVIAPYANMRPKGTIRKLADMSRASVIQSAQNVIKLVMQNFLQTDERGPAPIIMGALDWQTGGAMKLADCIS